MAEKLYQLFCILLAVVAVTVMTAPLWLVSVPIARPRPEVTIIVDTPDGTITISGNQIAAEKLLDLYGPAQPELSL